MAYVAYVAYVASVASVAPRLYAALGSLWAGSTPLGPIHSLYAAIGSPGPLRALMHVTYLRIHVILKCVRTHFCSRYTYVVVTYVRGGPHVNF